MKYLPLIVFLDKGRKPAGEGTEKVSGGIVWLKEAGKGVRGLHGDPATSGVSGRA